MQMTTHILQMEGSLKFARAQWWLCMRDASEQLVQTFRRYYFWWSCYIHTENSKDDSDLLWHLCLGHMSEWAIEELHKRNKKWSVASWTFVSIVYLKKQTKVSFKVTEKENCTKGILDYIQSDVWDWHRQNLMAVLAIISHSWMIIHERFVSTLYGRNLKSLRSLKNEKPK